MAHDHSSHSINRRLRIAIPLTGSIFLVEFVGGIWSGSLALLSDSLHVLFDVTALILSYAAIVLATRPPTDRHSYGLHRMEILSALINGLVLLWGERARRVNETSPRPDQVEGPDDQALLQTR